MFDRDVFSGDFFYEKSTIGTTKAAIEANNDMYCLRKGIKKFPLVCVNLCVSNALRLTEVFRKLIKAIYISYYC